MNDVNTGFSLELGTAESILAALGDGVTLHNRDFRIFYENRAMAGLFGEHTGQYCYSAYWGRDAPCEACPLLNCFAAGDVVREERRIEIDGVKRVLEITATPLRGTDGEIVAAVEVYRDVTLRKQADENLIRFSNLYRALSQTNRAIMYSADRETLFREICRVAVDHGNFSLAWIWTPGAETGILQAATFREGARDYLDFIRHAVDSGEAEVWGVPQPELRDTMACICNDLDGDILSPSWRAAARKSGIRSSALFPLWQGGKSAGVFHVYAEDRGFFDEEIIALLLEMAANISFALDNFSKDEELRYLSTHDALTGLFNRSYFETEMRRLAAGRSYPVSIVVADIDGLKHVNDTFGHLEGDRLIRMAARALHGAFRGGDVVARIGGDEFAVLLPETGSEAVRQAVKRVLKLQEEINEGNRDYLLSISIGAATAQSNVHLAEAFREADALMYRYKLRRKTADASPPA